jgi:hypothetical protein
MEPGLQSLEREMIAHRDGQFIVKQQAPFLNLPDLAQDLRKVAAQRFSRLGPYFHIATPTRKDGAKAIPFGPVKPAGRFRQCLDLQRLYRRDGRTLLRSSRRSRRRASFADSHSHSHRSGSLPDRECPSCLGSVNSLSAMTGAPCCRSNAARSRRGSAGPSQSRNCLPCREFCRHGRGR